MLCWNYKAADFVELEKLNLFEFLSKGDGTDLCWVNYHMGNYRKFGDAGSVDSSSLE